MATRLYRTQTAGTDRKKFTLSMWVKRTVPSVMTGLWCTEGGWYDGTGMACVFRDDNGSSIMNIYNPSEGGTGGNYNTTTQAFRDCNGWYHFVFAGDTTQSTQADRLKIYVNGEQISYATNNLPAQNVFWNDLNSNNKTFSIGAGSGTGGGAGYYHHQGILSHVHMSDGYVYDASTFGETDSTTGEWKIKTNPTFTLGNNGFTILKDGNTYTDQSSNSNNFSLSGTLTKTEDCPSNVFCTWNPLNSYYAGGTFSWGNNKVVLPNKYGAWNTGTLGMTSGKYYWEVKVGGDNNGAEVQVGIADKSPTGNSSSNTAGTSFGYNSNGEYGIYAWNGAFIGNAVANPYTSYGSSCANGYIMIAVDLDNNKFYGGVNGTWFGSGNPSNGTNGKTIQAVANTADGCYYPAISTFQGYSGTVETNFGNGYFADNAVSSAGTNASGNGIFEYDVPTGFTALSTKGLNE